MCPVSESAKNSWWLPGLFVLFRGEIRMIQTAVEGSLSETEREKVFLPSHSSQTRAHMLHAPRNIHGFERQMPQVVCEPNITEALGRSWVFQWNQRSNPRTTLEVVLDM